MDINTISTLITGLGFPIFMCVAMGFVGFKLFTNFFDYFKKLLDGLNESLKEMATTVDRNTVVMEKILTKLDMDGDDKK